MSKRISTYEQWEACDRRVNMVALLLRRKWIDLRKMPELYCALTPDLIRERWPCAVARVFVPAVSLDSLEWRNGLIVSTARMILQSQRWDEMATLADMIEESENWDRQLLEHLRKPASTHGPDCWALSLLATTMAVEAAQ